MNRRKPKQRKTQLPKLTADIVTDEQALVEATEGVLLTHSGMLKHRSHIIRRQQELRRVADDKAWKAYLRLEEAVNGRYDLALRLAAAWAFREGRKCR